MIGNQHEIDTYPDEREGLRDYLYELLDRRARELHPTNDAEELSMLETIWTRYRIDLEPEPLEEPRG